MNAQGFSFVEDVVYSLADTSRYRLHDVPTAADILFVVSTQDRGLYEATSLAGTGGERDFMVRTIQGQSGAVARQIDLDQAHERIFDRQQIPILVHHTTSRNLFDFLGMPGAPGIIPGGRLAWDIKNVATRPIALRPWRLRKVSLPTNSASAAPTVPVSWIPTYFTRPLRE